MDDWVTKLLANRPNIGTNDLTTTPGGGMSPAGWAAYTANSQKIYQQFVDQNIANGMDPETAKNTAVQQYSAWGQAQHNQMYSDANAAPLGIKELGPMVGNNGLNIPLSLAAIGTGAAYLGGGLGGVAATTPEQTTIGQAIGGNTMTVADNGILTGGPMPAGVTPGTGVAAVNAAAPGSITMGLTDAELAALGIGGSAAATIGSSIAGNTPAVTTGGGVGTGTVGTVAGGTAAGAVAANSGGQSTVDPTTGAPVAPPPTPGGPTIGGGSGTTVDPTTGEVVNPPVVVPPVNAGGGTPVPVPAPAPAPGDPGNPIIGGGSGVSVDSTTGAITGLPTNIDWTGLIKTFGPAAIGALIGATGNQAGNITKTPWNAAQFSPVFNAGTNLLANNQLNLPNVPTLPSIDPTLANNTAASNYADAIVRQMQQSFSDPNGPLAAIRADTVNNQPGGGTRNDLAAGIAASREGLNEGQVRAQIMNAIYPTNLNYNLAAQQGNIANQQWQYGNAATAAQAKFQAPLTNLGTVGNVFTGASGSGSTTQLPNTPSWMTAIGGAVAGQGLYNQITRP